MTEDDLRKLAESAARDPTTFLIAGNHNIYGIDKLVRLAKGTLDLLDKQKGKA